FLPERQRLHLADIQSQAVGVQRHFPARVRGGVGGADGSGQVVGDGPRDLSIRPQGLEQPSHGTPVVAVDGRVKWFKRWHLRSPSRTLNSAAAAADET